MPPRLNDDDPRVACGSFTERVLAVLERLEPGEVVSYGEVAAQAGSPGAARAVGHVLATHDGCPWWRVITADGRLAPGLEQEQTRRLHAEGVWVVGGSVVVRRQP